MTDSASKTVQVYTGNGSNTSWVSNPANNPSYPNLQGSNAHPIINNAGAVEFGAQSYNSTTGAFYEGISQNGTFTPIAQGVPGNNFGGNNISFNNFEAGYLNNNGQVALMVNSTSNKGYIYRYTPGVGLVTIAQQTQPTSLLSMNDNGYIAYFGLNNSTIMLSNGITTTAIVTASTLDPGSGLALDAYRFNVSVNNLNQVAFRSNGNGPQGIYIGDGTSLTTVARVGDTLFGSKITGLDLTSQSLNDAGQIVFSANLADGRTTIVRGPLPSAVNAAAPEPGSLALAILPLGSLVLVGIRRRNTFSSSQA